MKTLSILFLLFSLFGCGDDSKKEVSKACKNFNSVWTYEDEVRTLTLDFTNYEKGSPIVFIVMSSDLTSYYQLFINMYESGAYESCWDRDNNLECDDDSIDTGFYAKQCATITLTSTVDSSTQLWR